MNILDNRISPEHRIQSMLVEVRQQIAGASLGNESLFTCLLLIRNALQRYIDSDPMEMEGMYSTRNNVLGEARDHVERAVARYGMNILAQFVPALERIGAQQHRWNE